jgi:hypothetical protein
VALAVQTGISWREWLADPPAMITALEVLEEIARRTAEKR